MDTPKTLLDAIIFFSDSENCRQFMIAVRWEDRIVRCPRCGSENISYMPNAKQYHCKAKTHKDTKFSLKVGTIFEDSPIGLEKWLPATWMISNCKNGISSYEIARAIGITQKAAWHMAHRIRKAMHNGSMLKLSGECEADETFIGGKARNMHLSIKARRITGTGTVDKIAVMASLSAAGKSAQPSLPTARRRPFRLRSRSTSRRVRPSTLTRYAPMKDLPRRMPIRLSTMPSPMLTVAYTRMVLRTFGRS